MSKQMSRVTGVVAPMLFAVAVMLFAVAADSPAQSQKPAKAQPTPKPNSGEFHSFRFGTVFTTKISHIDASCNTTQGCKALKNICEMLPKHGFAANENGSVGVCADTTRDIDDSVWFVRQQAIPVSGGTAHTKTAGNTSNEGGNNEAIQKQPGGSQAQGKRRYAPVAILKRIDMSTPALNCEGAAICSKVQNTCATLGGTYKPRNDVSGSCKH